MAVVGEFDLYAVDAGHIDPTPHTATHPDHAAVTVRAGVLEAGLGWGFHSRVR